MPEGLSAMFLSGDAGIGKTTLWNWATGKARDRGYRVLASRPSQAEAKLSFSGLSDLLGSVDDGQLESLSEPQHRALSVALLREGPREEDDGYRAVSAACLSVLHGLAAQAPLVLAVDDLQWLDRPTRDVLEFVLRRLEREPVCLLASRRSGSRGRGDLGLGRILMEDRLLRLDLGPMSSAELDGLLRRRLDFPFRRTELELVHSTSQGNPFFALEIGRLLKSKGGLESERRLAIPESLADLLSDRLEALSLDARDVVRAASVLSEPTVTVVRKLVGESAKSGLTLALNAGVLELDGDRLTFSHPLLASVAYGQIPEGDRRELHRRACEAVADPEERARHLALGTEGTDASVADLVEEAATRAFERGAPSSAAQLWEKAVSFTPRQEHETAWRRSIEAAHCHTEAGDTDRARSVLREVVAAAPEGKIRGEALMLLGEWDKVPAEAIAKLEEALHEVGTDAELGFKVRRYLVGQCIRAGQLEHAASHAQMELELGRGLRSAYQAAALIHTAETDFLLGKGLQEDLIEEALRLDPGSRERLTAAWLILTAGDLARADPYLKDLRERVEQRGEENLLPAVLLLQAELSFRAGNWEDATRHASEGHMLAGRFGWEPLLPWSLAATARIHAAMGEIERGRHEAIESLSLMEAAGQQIDILVFPLQALGFIELSASDPASAHRYLSLALERRVQMALREPGYLRFVPDEIEALVQLGDLKGAEDLLNPFEERSKALGREFGLATSARCRGLIRAASGDIDGAIASFDQAILHHERVKEPFEFARTLLVMGTTQRRAKRRLPARQSLQQALEIFTKLGATPWAARANSELSRIAGRAPGPEGLTPTEAKIAELVAEGKSNPEIASIVFVTPKTVEANLTRIYRKMGVKSRFELAARMGKTPPA